MEVLTSFFKEFSVVIIPFLTIISIAIAYSAAKQTMSYRKKQDAQKQQEKIEQLTRELQSISLEKQHLNIELTRVKNAVMETTANNMLAPTTPESNENILQLEKVMYVKFLYLVPDSHDPVYHKYVSRIKKEVPVRTESVHYRLNRFNKKINFTVVDSSNHGVVDMTVIYPWKKRLSGPRSRVGNSEKLIMQELSDSDTFITTSTYLNGFEKGEEKYSIMAEYETKTAKLILDFSSIPGFDKLFKSEPKAFRFFDEAKKEENPINGCIHVLNKGTYALIVNDLEREEIIQLQFDVNWDYVDDLDVPKKSEIN